ncbi:MAG: hypothetical protein AAGI07_05825 [Bacteroidota bacterium]
MNRLSKLFSLIALFASLLIVSSCDDDDDDPVLDRPAVTTPTPAVSVTTGNEAAITFNVVIPGGYASANSSVGTLSDEPTVGATTGNIIVNYTPTSAGTTTITLTVNDQQNKSTEVTAAVIATDTPAGAPSISGIPATATISAGDTLRVPDVVLTAEAGLTSLAIAVNGTDVPALREDLTGQTSPLTVPEFVAAPTASFAPGNYTIVFTLTDATNQTATFTHTLTVDPAPEVIVSNNISDAVTWSSDSIYVLAGRITVLDGGTLTIEAGTVVKGQGGQGANATALLIARGGTLIADGNAANPIIFTSTTDEIQPGQIASPNLNPTVSNLWGGVIICGRAPISVDGDNETKQIEGIPPSDTNGLYGGNDPTDNSGIIRYVSIRHGGTDIGEGDEINGLTLGGVGSATTVEYVEVIANKDDGIEWFGGTVNVNNAVVWNAGDDAIDTDADWIGTLDNFVVITGGIESPDHALELDGPEGTRRSGGHTLQNGSVKGSTTTELGQLRDSVEVTLTNIFFFNFPDPAADENNDGEADGRGDFSMEDDVLPNYNAEGTGTVVLSGLEVILPDGISLDAVFKNGTDANATGVTAGTVGATLSEFERWSWTQVSGSLDDF